MITVIDALQRDRRSYTDVRCDASLSIGRVSS